MHCCMSTLTGDFCLIYFVDFFSGYLLIYSLIGTEYCCPGINLYCPNSGNCDDGSVPLLTQANTTQYYSAYQIYTNTSWADGFFGAYCPFTTTTTTSSGIHGIVASWCVCNGFYCTATSQLSCALTFLCLFSCSDDSASSYTPVQVALVTLFAVLFVASLAVIMWLYWKLHAAQALLAKSVLNSSA